MEYEYIKAEFTPDNEIIITGYQKYLNGEQDYPKRLALVKYPIKVDCLSSFMPIIREGEPVDFNKGEKNVILSSIEENGKIPLNHLPLIIMTETPSIKINIIIGVIKDGETICIRKEVEKQIGSDDIEYKADGKESVITLEEAARELERSGIDLEASKSSLPKDQILKMVDTGKYSGIQGVLTRLFNLIKNLIQREADQEGGKDFE